MRLGNRELIIGAGILALVLLTRSAKDRIFDKLASFIPSVESFSATPYWDVSRYSWGYGTAAPGSTGTITRDQAFRDMIGHLLADYNSLVARITVPLTVNQWVALLSFSYNAGIGSAYNLVPLINTHSSQLGNKWNAYVYAGGVRNATLVERRKKEFSLYSSG